MISRRKFFSITILMFVVFFLCMFINNLKDTWNDYTINTYLENAEDYPSQVNIFLPGSAQNKENPGEEQENTIAETAEVVARNRVVCIGDTETAIGKTLMEWAAYTKREFSDYKSLSSFQKKAADEEELPEMLLIDAACADWEKEKELSFLMECVEQGTHLVFCTLPEASVIAENETLQNLLGIREVTAEETTVDGIHLYGGFLLGGETIWQANDEEEEEKYQDMELTFPWYHLSSGTKVYMKGILEDETTEDYPVLIWRKSFGTAYVFAVNGGYMDGKAALGLLSAISAEMYSYEVYPVVNAQCISFVNFPSLAAENKEKIDELYSQSLKQVFQETVLPDISVELQQYKYDLTCMMTPQFDYLDSNLPDPDQMAYYLKIFNEQSVEVGLSGISKSDVTMEKKLSEDDLFLQDAVGGYEFASFYAGNLGEEEVEGVLQEDILSSVRTVLADADDGKEIVRFLSEYVTEQSILGNGLSYTYRSDFLTRCVETAIGYFNLSCDMGKVAYPEDKEDSWEKVSERLATTLAAYEEISDGFDGTTVSESDLRIRHFLALDYEDRRVGDKVYLEMDGTWGTAYFILRTHEEDIKDVEGGSWKELEDGIYLIEAQEQNLTITLKMPDENYYH